MEHYDFCIAGSGPAGATLARILAAKYRVLVLERRRLDLPFAPGMAGKCCGGLLASDAQKVLGAFDLALPEKVMGGPQLFAVRACDLDSGCEKLYQRFYLNMDREAFDRWLAELAEAAGAEFRFGAEYRAWGDGVVRWSVGGKMHCAGCRRLILATGACGAAARGIAPDELYVALQQRLPNESEHRHFDAFFSSQESDFYAWAIPKRDGLLFGGAFPRENATERFAALKEKLAARGWDFSDAEPCRGALLVRPRRGASVCCGEGDVLRIGEAGGFISPSSAEGFSFAFRSAALLGELLKRNPAIPAEHYAKCAAPLRRILRGKRWKSRVMYCPFLRGLIMKSGVGTLSHLED